jgi:hypothetical protein
MIFLEYCCDVVNDYGLRPIVKPLKISPESWIYSMSEHNTMIRNDSGQIDLFKMLMGVLTSLITLGIAALIVNNTTFQVAIAEINKDVLNLSVTLEAMSEESLRRDSNRYTGSQSVADWRLQASVDSIQDDTLKRFEERADLLEARIEAQETQFQ